METKVTDAPDRIWIDKNDIAAVSETSQVDPDYVEYARVVERDTADVNARPSVCDFCGDLASGVSKAEELLHIAMCNGVGFLNYVIHQQEESRQAHDVLRQALDDYANIKAAVGEKAENEFGSSER